MTRLPNDEVDEIKFLFVVSLAFIFTSGSNTLGARCSSVVKAVAHGAMGRRIDPS